MTKKEGDIFCNPSISFVTHINNGVPRLNEVFRLLAETLISISIFYMLNSMKLLLPVKSLGLFLYNPMYKEIKYTSHMKLMAKKKTLLNLQEGASCY